MRCVAAVLLAFAVASSRASGPGEGADVVTLTDDNFREEVVEHEGLVLVEFYAPWCGHCKTLAPEWDKAATSLKGKAKLAALDATVHDETAKLFGVSGYPTIIAFAHGKKEDEEGIIYDQYNGGRDADGIVEYAGEELMKVGIDISQIEELVSQDVLDACTAKKYCAVFTLPHVIDSGADGRNRYIETVKELSRNLGRSNPSSFAWVQSGNQQGLEDSMQVSAFPGMLVINKDRSRFHNHIGPFTVAALSKTIRALQTGRLTASTFKTLPVIEKTAPWDGKDYVYEEEEEDL